jgi:hypothetical protein
MDDSVKTLLDAEERAAKIVENALNQKYIHCLISGQRDFRRPKQWLKRIFQNTDRTKRSSSKSESWRWRLELKKT